MLAINFINMLNMTQQDAELRQEALDSYTSSVAVAKEIDDSHTLLLFNDKSSVIFCDKTGEALYGQHLEDLPGMMLEAFGSMQAADKAMQSCMARN